MEVYGLE